MILREARRFYRGSRLLSLSGVVVLALGIGASAVLLALMLAFSSLTYPGMRNIAYATIAEETEGGGSIQIAWPRFEQLRASTGGRTTLAAYSKIINTTLEVNGNRRPVRVAAISSGFFSVFTPRLVAGRDFSQIEEVQAVRRVAILSHLLAKSLFGSAENALERFVVIDGLAYKVVGVAPSGFRGIFGDLAEAWVPASCVIPLILKAPSGESTAPDVWKYIAAFYGVGESDHVSSTELVADLVHSLPLRVGSDAPLHVSQGLTTDPVREIRLRKWLRLGFLLALFFTIVSSLNYSLLLLARTPRYAKEVSLKRALGAGIGRLMAELMIGPATMVGSGLVAAFMFWAVAMILISRVPAFGQPVRGSLHTGFLAFGIQVPLACGLTLLIALIPALSFLREGAPRGGYESTGNQGTGFLLQFTVTLQIAFCIATWILAGMIVSTVTSLMRENLGYNPSHLTVVSIGPGPGGVSFAVGANRSFPTVSAIRSLIDEVTDVPGVRSASFASNAPFDPQMGTLTLQRIDDASAPPRTVNQVLVSPDYFRTMGTRTLRESASSESLTWGVNEIVINEALSKELWPKESPLNRAVRLTDPNGGGIPAVTFAAVIVGVVEDMRISGVSASPEPTVYLSVNGAEFFDISPYLVVNGSESEQALQDVVHRQVAALMPGLGVLSTYSVNDRARASLLREKQRAYCSIAGALTMALLACIGLYGALAYYVGSKRRELAVRICVGASPWAIRRIILARAAWCAISAVILCIPVWPILAQLSSNDYLGRVSWSTGRAILISMGCVSASVVISLVPATAAASISPADALKEQ